jgi:hypothetical protein
MENNDEASPPVMEKRNNSGRRFSFFLDLLD